MNTTNHKAHEENLYDFQSVEPFVLLSKNGFPDKFWCYCNSKMTHEPHT
jgi:hypothetical protein